jgi:hypothetical protein
MEQIDWINIIIAASIIIAIMVMTVYYMYKKSVIKLKSVHAGPANTRSFYPDTTDVTLSFFDTFYHNGELIHPKDYEVRIVDGKCMEKRGIRNGNILFIEKLSEYDEEKKKEKIRKGDILFIKKESDAGNLYKIREFSDFDSSGELLTFSYSGDTRCDSSSSHSLDRIEGIVKMNFKGKGN